MKKQSPRSYKKLLGAFIIIVGLVIGHILPFNTNSTETRNQLIEDYITYLSKADISSSIQTSPSFRINYAGMGTESVSSEIAHIQSIAQQQNALVLEQFGVNAWDNVEYTLTYRPPVDGTLGYREISSGKIISENKYDSILKDYWEEVAQIEGVDYYDLFPREGESPESMSNKRIDLISKYMSNVPVEMTLVSDTEETYIVNLSFNSLTKSQDGFGNFHFVIDNRTGEWEIFEGLTWSEPLPEYPTGD